MIVLTEKDRDILEKTILRNKVDVILLRGKDFSLAIDNISQKEKGFIDLYYAVTRMEYGVSIPELCRIYQSLQRNNSIAMAKMKAAAKDRGISVEIDWLIEMNKAVLEESKVELIISVKISVSPKKNSLPKATIKAITKKATQM